MNVFDQVVTDRYSVYHADTVEVARTLLDDSVDHSVFSPPFASLYTYSNSPRDMGNCRGVSDFMEHYRYLIREQMRVMKPGRLIAIHCMLLPASKERHGHIGLIDFRGDLIRAYEKEGFIFHSEVAIWKDPVTAMQRTKALGLLHKTIRKDSAMSRQGINDYVIVMRKPGRNPDPIAHTADEFPVELWQRYASPVWALTGQARDDGFYDVLPDINPSETLQYASAREHDDERHIAPLQLEVIRRCVRLWSNPGDIVWSPFAGIGSEGYVSLQEGRKFIGAELKASYFAQMKRNLAKCVADEGKQPSLFGAVGT
jgi:DNA modification methylase